MKVKEYRNAYAASVVIVTLLDIVTCGYVAMVLTGPFGIG